MKTKNGELMIILEGVVLLDDTREQSQRTVCISFHIGLMSCCTRFSFQLVANFLIGTTKSSTAIFLKFPQYYHLFVLQSSSLSI